MRSRLNTGPRTMTMSRRASAGPGEEKPMDKLLLTPEEAATVLSLGRSKVYELIRDGRLTSVLIDTSRRIPTGALADFVAQLQEDLEISPDR